MSFPKVVHVAVGVIERISDAGLREILISKRPDEVHQGGLWEFPGGKVEENESLPVALARELEEELGLLVDAEDAEALRPLIQISHDYGDKQVLLDVWLVKHFSHAPENGIGREGQQVLWVEDVRLDDFSFPKANVPIITACQLPEFYMVTPLYPSLGSARKEVTDLLEKHSGMVLLRQPELTQAEYFAWVDELLDSVPALGKRLMLSANVSDIARLDVVDEDESLSLIKRFERYKGRVKGLHLPFFVAQNVTAQCIDSEMLLAVSCHSASELQHAQSIHADFVTLSPVQNTRSHPDASPIGWSCFEAWTKSAKIPVYALGGVARSDLGRASLAGGQGIAGISAWVS